MDLQNLVECLRKGEPRAIARALTLVENDDPEARELLSHVFGDERSAKIVGLTGPPGVGKSTLVDVLAKAAREHDRDVAVLAVDPTSPFTGGALLGDRARMDSSTADPKVFIRSMATRGHVGGLTSAVFEALVLLAAAGKDFILVETVGAGQDEVEVAAAVDVTVVVLAPGLGDRIQASKAGLMEIADILVINKADRDGADLVAEEAHAHTDGKPVFKTVALDGTGVAQLFAEIERTKGERRLMEGWLLNCLQRAVRERIPADAWAAAVERVNARQTTPYDAAAALLESLKS
ncbi:MAG: methylmalonyl Co-A mutase-associated GTPase MeaB [Acidobacteriota bacterium]|nr:MAG: methylmalonyl Co-A mutase-associated GTPase MeaB [Acidobacteriota bacterium]